MGSSPQVSVIIPIFNSECYLSQCIEGILNQNFPDFEVILIDDGSTDDSWEICRKYELSDSRIKAYRQDNAGASAARNLGLNVAEGKWVLFMDSDDFATPTYISNLHDSVSADSRIVLANSGVQVYREGKPAEKRGFKDLVTDVKDYKTLFEGIRLHKYGFSVGKLYDRSIIEKANLRFDEKVCIAEDCMFMLHYLILCHNMDCAKVSFIEQCDYHYFIRHNSLSTSCSSVERELYSYCRYRSIVDEVKLIWGVDSQTYDSLLSPIVYYADRLINSVYETEGLSSARKALLKHIDRKKYKKYKKSHSVFECFLKELFVYGPFCIYDSLRKRI